MKKSTRPSAVWMTVGTVSKVSGFVRAAKLVDLADANLEVSFPNGTTCNWPMMQPVWEQDNGERVILCHGFSKN